MFQIIVVGTSKQIIQLKINFDFTNTAEIKLREGEQILF